MVSKEQVGASGDLLDREVFAALLETYAFAAKVGLRPALLGASRV